MRFFGLWRHARAHDPESVYVEQRFGVRTLHIGSATVQSAMRLSRPNDLELAYTRSMMAFLLFNEAPRRVLLVGLGGGSLAKFIYHRMPHTTVEAVEINPRVVAVAREHFLLPPDDTRLSVVIDDGARYLARPGPAADVIAVDAYDGLAQAAALATRPFYVACRLRLAPQGVLVVNLWSSDRGFEDCLARLESAFPAGTLCLPARRPGNVIVLAFRDSPGVLRWEPLCARARALQARYGIEFVSFVAALRDMNRSDAEQLYVR
jgi:spermidine synthase